jgi:hypothetical protein
MRSGWFRPLGFVVYELSKLVVRDGIQNSAIDGQGFWKWLAIHLRPDKLAGENIKLPMSAEDTV